jgi:hypothetical protein
MSSRQKGNSADNKAKGRVESDILEMRKELNALRREERIVKE